MTTADIPSGTGARAANALPLAGDTGATSPGWAIDWLSVTVWGVDVDRVARLAPAGAGRRPRKQGIAGNVSLAAGRRWAAAS